MRLAASRVKSGRSVDASVCFVSLDEGSGRLRSETAETAAIAGSASAGAPGLDGGGLIWGLSGGSFGTSRPVVSDDTSIGFDAGCLTLVGGGGGGGSVGCTFFLGGG